MSREGEGVDQRLVGEVDLQVGCGIKSDWVVICLLKAPQLCLVQLEVEEELQGLLSPDQSYLGRGSLSYVKRCKSHYHFNTTQGVLGQVCRISGWRRSRQQVSCYCFFL